MIGERPENRLVECLFHEGQSMMRKLSTWLVIASAGGLLVAGCGSSSTTTSTAAPATATTAPTNATKAPAAATTSPTNATKAPAATTNAPATATGTTRAKPGPKTLQGLAACKRAINAERALPASEKLKLEAVCDRFAGTTSPTTPSATGNVIPLSDAVKACLERVSHLPAGAARLRALAACKAN
jgi:hypothetical protein